MAPSGPRDVRQLIDLFTEDARLERLPRPGEEHGREGARAFWTAYMDNFRQVRSRFTHLTENDERAALEWTATGELPDGRPVTYSGVSIIEWREDRACGFRTYYDSAVFVHPRSDDRHT